MKRDAETAAWTGDEVPPGDPTDPAASGDDDLDPDETDDDGAGDEPGGEAGWPAPALDATDEVEQGERHARRLYVWLFLSPLITVPWMLIGTGTNYRGSTLAYLQAALTPALVHLIMIFGLSSPHRFVRAHTQQALLLALVRTLTTVLLIGLTGASQWGAWLLVNGFLWLHNFVWGKDQVSSGDCWWMRVRGEADLLPRPWAVGGTAATAASPVALGEYAPSGPPAGAGAAVPAAPEKALARGRALADEGRRDEAVASLMLAFRFGDAGVRGRALAELEKLGEVERG